MKLTALIALVLSMQSWSTTETPGKITTGSQVCMQSNGHDSFDAVPCPADKSPQPVWVPDPSAGHFDCPEGWMAYTRTEPIKYKDMFQSNPAVYVFPKLDAKGHLINTQPDASGVVCITESR